MIQETNSKIEDLASEGEIAFSYRNYQKAIEIYENIIRLAGSQENSFFAAFSNFQIYRAYLALYDETGLEAYRLKKIEYLSKAKELRQLFDNDKLSKPCKDYLINQGLQQLL
jgi:hypothetical protein